jgi:hypothetical protein
MTATDGGVVVAPKSFTLHDIAAMENVCYDTVWRYVKRYQHNQPGGLRATRRGTRGNWRVTEADYLAWVSGR